MADIVPFYTAEEVRKKYPGMWEISAGRWGQVCKKSFGPFIATIFHLYGQELRWRVKELRVSMDDKQEFVKSYHVKGAGRNASMIAARKHIEEVVLPRLVAWHEREHMRKEVAENVG